MEKILLPPLRKTIASIAVKQKLTREKPSQKSRL